MELDYDLQVSVPDEFGRISVCSNAVPGLVLYGKPTEILSDAPEAIRLMRELTSPTAREASV